MHILGTPLYRKCPETNTTDLNIDHVKRDAQFMNINNVEYSECPSTEENTTYDRNSSTNKQNIRDENNEWNSLKPEHIKHDKGWIFNLCINYNSVISLKHAFILSVIKNDNYF